MNKPPRNFWQIWNMSFGFLGIQFGWGLQMANMSAIYEYLGAQRRSDSDSLARRATHRACMVQPIIGTCERSHVGTAGPPSSVLPGGRDSQFARAHPHAEQLRAWMAAGLLWILDASINISMEPFRAFVADMLPERTAHRGFAMQSLFIGLGAVVASALPWLLTNVFHVTEQLVTTRVDSSSPALSFYIGAVAFFGAVLWTIMTTKEYPPDDLEAFRQTKKEKTGLSSQRERNLRCDRRDAAQTMRQLAPVQLLHVAGLVLHVAIFSGCRGAQRVRRARYRFTALCRRRRMGRDLFRSIFCRLFCVFVCSPRDCRQTRPQKHAQLVPALRSPRTYLGCNHPRQIYSPSVHGRRRHRLGQHPLHALCRARRISSAPAKPASTWASSTSLS